MPMAEITAGPGGTLCCNNVPIQAGGYIRLQYAVSLPQIPGAPRMLPPPPGARPSPGLATTAAAQPPPGTAGTPPSPTSPPKAATAPTPPQKAAAPPQKAAAPIQKPTGMTASRFAGRSLFDAPDDDEEVITIGGQAPIAPILPIEEEEEVITIGGGASDIFADAHAADPANRPDTPRVPGMILAPSNERGELDFTKVTHIGGNLPMKADTPLEVQICWISSIPGPIHGLPGWAGGRERMLKQQYGPKDPRRNRPSYDHTKPPAASTPVRPTATQEAVGIITTENGALFVTDSSGTLVTIAAGMKADYTDLSQFSWNTQRLLRKNLIPLRGKAEPYGPVVIFDTVTAALYHGRLFQHRPGNVFLIDASGVERPVPSGWRIQGPD